MGQTPSDNEMCGLQLRGPDPEGLIDCVAEGALLAAARGVNGDNHCAEDAHAQDSQGLTFEVLGAHKHGAFHAEMRA